MYQTHVFENGLKLIHYYIPNKAAYCGVMINAGSRDEKENESGMAHFIEHVIFKGTKKRKAYHILSRMEDVGGELNAYTTKEDTCVHASFMAKDYERALELFSDIIFNSVFPEKEIEKEKDVVLDEIDSYKDSPGELIFDEFEEMVYSGYSIGRNILGDESSVENINKEMIHEFVNRNYSPKRMVISSVGDIVFEKLIRLVEKYFGHHSNENKNGLRVKPEIYVPRLQIIDKDTHQSHCIMGNIAYDYTQEKRVGLSLLINLLGGTGMNSRLNLNIREKYGIAYNIEANYTTYSDTGVYMIYFGCDKENAEMCMNLCKRELKDLRMEKLGPNQLKRAKAQMIGQLTISAENYENLMLSIGKSFLVYDKVDNMDVVYKQIENISSDSLLEIANEVLDENKLSILLYK